MRSSAARGLGLAGKPLAAKAVPALLALSALLVGALLGGCSADPEPAGRLPDPTSSAAVSSVPTPSPSLSTRSVEAEVEAAVRAYYAELTRAAQTNDTSRLKRLVRKSCPCYNAVHIIERNARERETTKDASFAVRSVNVRPGSTQGLAAAEVVVRARSYDVVTAAGTVKTHVNGRRSHLDLSLAQRHGVWVIANSFDLED